MKKARAKFGQIVNVIFDLVAWIDSSRVHLIWVNITTTLAFGKGNYLKGFVLGIERAYLFHERLDRFDEIFSANQLAVCGQEMASYVIPTKQRR